MKKNKKILIVAFCFCIFGFLLGLLSLGIVFFSKKETIDLERWNVYFTNLSTSIRRGEVFVPEEPLLEATSIKAYDVLVKQPGDTAIYTFDVVNKGTFDAKLETFSKMNPICTSLALPEVKEDAAVVCENLEYSLTYTKTGKEVAISDLLKAGESTNITLKIGYSENATEVPSEAVQITILDLTAVYNQENKR